MLFNIPITISAFTVKMKLLVYEIYQLNFEISLLFIILPVNKQSFTGMISPKMFKNNTLDFKM